MGTGRRFASAGAAAALVAVGGLGSFLLHSPDERLVVDVPRTTITADVRSAVLTTEHTGTGTFSAGGVVEVAVAPPDGMSAVVTGTPVAPGAQVPWCTPVVEVSGRPVLLLHGDVPAYRDLVVGDEGDDVRRLQEALRECGAAVATDGVFGARTAQALTALYRKVGHRVAASPASALGASAASATPAAPDAGATTQVVHTVRPEAEQHDDAHGGTVDSDTVQWVPVTGTVDPGSEAPAPGTAAPPAPAPSPSAGPTVVAPRGELLFLPAQPRVATVSPVGTTLSGPAISLTSASDQFVLALSAAQRAAVTAGAPLTISRDDWTATTTVPDVPSSPTVDDDGNPTYPVVVPLTAPVPPGFQGGTGEFTVTIGSPDPHELVVPVSAVHADTASTSFVLRLVDGTPHVGDDPPPTERVDVRVLEAANGYAAVEPVGGSLSVGDEVVVGER